MYVVDLLPGYRREARYRRILRNRWVYGAGAFASVVVISGLVLASVLPADTGLSASELDRLNDSIARTQKSIVDYQPQLQETQRTLRANLSVRGQPDWSVLLMLLGKVGGAEIVLNRCKLEPVNVEQAEEVARPEEAGEEGAAAVPKPEQAAPQYVLSLSGLARSQTETSRFVLRLEQTGLFDRVRLVNTSRSRIEDMDLSAFQLTCDLKRDGDDEK